MNHKLIVAAVGALAAGIVSMSASAQTCQSPRTWQPPAAGEEISFTTCGADDAGAALMCGGTQDRVGPVYVIRSNFTGDGSATTISLSGAAAGFDPVVYMTPAAGGCGANQETCNPSGDTGAPLNRTDIPNGEWLIFVTAFGQNAPGTCGAVTLNANGSFPVTLTNFTVS